jgi:hypothetical protein
MVRLITASFFAAGLIASATSFAGEMSKQVPNVVIVKISNQTDKTSQQQAGQEQGGKKLMGEEQKAPGEQKPGEQQQAPGEQKPGEQQQAPGEQKPGEQQQAPGEQKPGEQKPGEQQQAPGEQKPGEQTQAPGEQKPGEQTPAPGEPKPGEQTQAPGEQKPGEQKPGDQGSQQQTPQSADDQQAVLIPLHIDIKMTADGKVDTKQLEADVDKAMQNADQIPLQNVQVNGDTPQSIRQIFTDADNSTETEMLNWHFWRPWRGGYFFGYGRYPYWGYNPYYSLYYNPYYSYYYGGYTYPYIYGYYRPYLGYNYYYYWR